MQSHQKEIVKDITSGSQLESELQISQAQHGVAVLDVYNAEWGSAKVLNEAFRRLHTDAGDLVHLRFFSVECNSVLESLKAPQEAKAIQRPKTAINYERDTFPSFWSPILESRCQHSKPFFVFFKEGKMRDTIEGIDTPKICKYIQDLCKQQNPITEYINNADLLQFWQKHFSPYENEVNWSSFVSALKKEGYPTDDATMSALAAATDAEAKVGVTNVQTWLGESATLHEKLTELQSASAARELPPQPEEKEEEKEGEWREMDENEKDGEQPAEKEQPEPEAEAEEVATPPPPPEQAPRELPEETTEPAEEAPPQEETNAGEADEWREMDEEQNAEPPTQAPPPAEGEEEATEEQPSAEAPRELPEEETEQAEEEPSQQEEVGEEEREPTKEGEADEWREMDEPKATEASVEEHHEEETAEITAEEDGQGEDEHRELGEDDGDAEDGHTIKRTEYVTETKEINQIYINGWVTVSDEEMHVWNAISEIPLHYPERTTAMLRPRDQVTDVDVPSAETLDTLAQYLEKQGVPPTSINMVCLAADQKIGSESLSYGKAALVLISGEADNLQELFPQLDQLHSDLSSGALLQKDAPVASTTMCLCASQVYADEAFYYILKEDERAQFEACVADQELVLSALAPLVSKRPDDDNSLKVRIAGMPKVIELASTDEGVETVVLSQWHSILKVTEHSDDVLSLQFVDYVAADAFQGFVTAYTERLMEDENKIERKAGSAGDDDDDAEGGEEEQQEEEVIDEDADEM